MKKMFIFLLVLFTSVGLIGCDFVFDNPNPNDKHDDVDDDNDDDDEIDNQEYDFQITYHVSDDNSDNIVQGYNKDDLSTYPIRPTKEGFMFRGWYNDSSYLTKYTFGNKVASSFNLYAKWEEPTADELLFSEVFDLNSNIKLELDMDDSEFAKLQADYEHYRSFNSKSPIYRYANSLTITVNGKPYFFDEVGVRMKGNTSRTSFFNSNNEYYNQIHLKFDFQETFDDEDDYGDDIKVWTNSEARKARKDRTFAGLEKLDIKWNKNYDQTYAREIYAFDFFKSQGLLAQSVNTSNFVITNNEETTNMGVFFIYEVIDELFIKRHLPEEDSVGDLYKTGWASSNDGHKGADYLSHSSYGVEDENKGLFYNFDLKTNKKKSSHESIMAFLNGINKEKNRETLSLYMDIDYLLKFEAANYLVGNPDDIRNNYNNHYLYFRNDGKAILIPYDYDRVLGINKDYNPSGDGMMSVKILSDKAVGAYQDQKNPIYLSILQSNTLKTKLVNNVKEMLTGEWFTYNHFKNYYYDIVFNKQKNDTFPDIDFDNVDESRLAFDLNIGTNNYSSTNSNINVSTYFTEKRKTALSN